MSVHLQIVLEADWLIDEILNASIVRDQAAPSCTLQYFHKAVTTWIAIDHSFEVFAMNKTPLCRIKYTLTYYADVRARSGPGLDSSKAWHRRRMRGKSSVALEAR